MGRLYEFYGALEAYESGAVCDHPEEAREKVPDGVFLDEVCTACGEKVVGG